MKKLVGFVAFAAVAAACSSIAPVPIKAGEVCYRCRTVIEEPKQAGEMIAGNGLVSPFKSPNCLAKYIVEHPEDKSAVFVSDWETGKFAPPDRMVFVPTVNRNNGEKSYLAFLSEKAAAAAAAEQKSTPIKWAAVLDRARQEGKSN